jgi:hypothetical protein
LIDNRDKLTGRQAESVKLRKGGKGVEGGKYSPAACSSTSEMDESINLKMKLTSTFLFLNK